MDRSRLIALTLPLAFAAAACSKHNNAAAGDTASAAGAIAPDTSMAPKDTTAMHADSAGMSATPTTTGTGAMLKTSNKPGVGMYLTDGTGKTLYMFTKDTKGTSACADKCATAWPPFTGTASASDSTVTASMLGTVTRADGTTQVTYNGMPLYYYHDDANAGDTKGANEKAFGGEWYLVGPSGMKASARAGKMKKS